MTRALESCEFMYDWFMQIRTLLLHSNTPPQHKQPLIIFSSNIILFCSFGLNVYEIVSCIFALISKPWRVSQALVHGCQTDKNVTWYMLIEIKLEPKHSRLVLQYIVTCYATKDAVRIGNPFIIILNHTYLQLHTINPHAVKAFTQFFPWLCYLCTAYKHLCVRDYNHVAPSCTGWLLS
jgi:hypothetical protein